MWKDNIQNKNMLYLLYCSIHGIEPDPVYLQNFDPEQLLSKCISHKVVALINNEVSRLPQDIISAEMKSVRISILQKYFLTKGAALCRSIIKRSL